MGHAETPAARLAAANAAGNAAPTPLPLPFILIQVSRVSLATLQQCDACRMAWSTCALGMPLWMVDACCRQAPA